MSPLVAGCDHSGQLVIEPCVDAAVAGQPEVNGGQLIDPKAAKVVLDALAQLVRIVEREHGTAVRLGGPRPC